jgi:hypothetical protein
MKRSVIIVSVCALCLLGMGCTKRIERYHNSANVLYALHEASEGEGLPAEYKAALDEWHDARKATSIPKVAELVAAFKSASGSKERVEIVLRFLKKG